MARTPEYNDGYEDGLAGWYGDDLEVASFNYTLNASPATANHPVSDARRRKERELYEAGYRKGQSHRGRSDD